MTVPFRETLLQPAAERPLVFFLHVPKAAGTTLNYVLRNEYAERGILHFGNVFRGYGGVTEQPLKRMRDRNPGEMDTAGMAATGHLPFAVRTLLPPETRSFTMLRDPIERTLSHFFYIRANREKLAASVSEDRPPLLDESAQLADVVRQKLHFPDNLQTRMHCDDLALTSPCTPQMLAQAKRNLVQEFDAVGLVERFDESLALYWKTFEWRSPLYPARRRVTADRPSRSDIPAADIAAIEEENAYDLELYAFAQELFDRRMAEQDDHFGFELTAMRLAQSRIQHAGDQPALADVAGDAALEYRVQLLVAEYERCLAVRRNQTLKARLTQAHTELDTIRPRLQRAAEWNVKLRARNTRLKQSVARLSEKVAAQREKIGGGKRGTREGKRNRKAARQQSEAPQQWAPPGRTLWRRPDLRAVDEQDE